MSQLEEAIDVRVTSTPNPKLEKRSLTAMAMDTKRGKEYLDKVDALARKYDKDGNGNFSQEEIREFALDLQEAVDQKVFWRRMFRIAATAGSLLFLLFTMVFVGAVVAAVASYKDPNDNPVMRKDGLQLVPGTDTVVRTSSAEMQVVASTSSLASFDFSAAVDEYGETTVLSTSPVLSDNDGQTLATASASFTAETSLQALLNLSFAELGEVTQLQMALDDVVDLYRVASFSAYGWAEDTQHRVLLLYVQDRRDTAAVLVSAEQALLLTGAELDAIQANGVASFSAYTTDASGRRRLRSTKEVLRREWPGRRRLWYSYVSSTALQIATASMAVAETLAAEAQAEAERVTTALNAAAAELAQIKTDMDSVPTAVIDGTDATVAARMRHLVYSMVFAGSAAADRQFEPEEGTSFNATVLFSATEVTSFGELVAAQLNAALDKTYCETTGVTNPAAATGVSCVGDNATSLATVVAAKQEELYGLAKYKPDTWVDESTYVAMRFLGDAAHGQVDTDTGTAVQVVRLMVWLSDIQSTACAKLNLGFTFGEDSLVGYEELLGDIFTGLMAFVQSFVDDTMEQLKLGMEAVLAPIEESINSLVATTGRRRLEDDEARASSSAAAVGALFLHALHSRSTTTSSPHAAAAEVAVASRRRHRRQLAEVDLGDLLRDVELITTTTLTFDVDIYSEIDMMPTFTTPTLSSKPIQVRVPVASPALEVVAEAFFDFQLSGTIYFKGSIGMHFPSNTLNVTVRFKPFATEGQLFYIDGYNFEAGQPEEITSGDLASSFGVELALSLYGKATGSVALVSPLGGVDFVRRSFVVDAHNVVVAGLVLSSNAFRGSWADPYRQLWSMPALTSTLGFSSSSNSSDVTSMTIWNTDMLRKQYGEGRDVAAPPGDASTCTIASAEFSNTSMLGKSQPCVDGTTALCCTSSLDVCVTSDALPHGKCLRDASACEGETNCKLHFPPIANCATGVTGLDSFVFLGAYQPLYYADDLDAPLRYNPSSGELAAVEKVNLTCPTREVFDPTYYPRNSEPMVDLRVFSLPCFTIAS